PALKHPNRILGASLVDVNLRPPDQLMVGPIGVGAIAARGRLDGEVHVPPSLPRLRAETRSPFPNDLLQTRGPHASDGTLERNGGRIGKVGPREKVNQAAARRIRTGPIG